ncbi:MAG: YhfC family intramembrane metalloprotease, partial [Anaerolineales bacterium]
MKLQQRIWIILILLCLVLLAVAGFAQPETVFPVLNALLMIGLGLGLGMLLAKRFGLSWGLFGAGALTFIGSQVLHIPFNNYLLNPLLAKITPQPTPGSTQLVIWALLLGLSAGVFEETARYLVLRFWRRDVTTWKKSLMFGAGHGGTEAIILGVLAFVAFIQISYYTRTGTAALQASMDAARFNALNATIAAYWNTQWYEHLWGAFERMSVLPVHLAATVLVFRSVNRRQFGWYLAAILWHALVDFVAVFASQTWSIPITEGIIFLLGLLGVAIVFAMRTPDPEPEETPEPSIQPEPAPFPLA